MPATFFIETLSRFSTIDDKTIIHWFENRGFRQIGFEDNEIKIESFDIYHTIYKRVGFDTFYKTDVGGSLLVFEIRKFDRLLECYCYSPMKVFGFCSIKVSFKPKSGFMAKYRQHGYEILSDFKSFINS